MQKMKSNAVKGIQIHNQREKESETNPDIDNEKSHLNYDLINGKNQIDYKEKIDQIISENITSKKAIRKDAVRLSEFLITSDRDFFDKIRPQEQERYFETAYEFLAKRYGEKNLIYASVHLDEKTPHMHVGFVPITEDGRLSAKDFFGQKRQLVSLQDDFNAHMKGNEFDLKRGVSTSRKHVETAKYKALTFHSLEQEAKENYEQTMERIHKITDKTKAIENIESKKVLGLVGMKEQDYQSLVDYATHGVVFQQKAEQLQKELEKAKSEVQQLRSDMQTGQDRVRFYYKDIEDNLEDIAEKKAQQKLQQHDVVKDRRELIDKYNRLVQKYNDQLEQKNKLKQQVDFLKIENLAYRNENRELKTENGKLQEKWLQINQEFSAFKQRVGKAFHAQFDRVKTFLRMNDVDKGIIKFLGEKQDKIVQDSLERLEKPQKQQSRGMGIER